MMKFSILVIWWGRSGRPGLLLCARIGERMLRDKKVEGVIPYFCFAFVFFVLLSAIILLTRGWLEQGIVLLAVGIALLPTAIVIAVSVSKSKSPSIS